ncbi:hypothetical protein F7725_003601 [Xyrichtys novacula]|uniref:Immunoglobulin V-set domain-containing protein n=1 Tax=Xyrichtys novacula TaxID=13765 RepID=A0AAV1GUX1_XYRNO|nr:hypothetical protein F7725_003601 [Xyrichtys novacula]
MSADSLSSKTLGPFQPLRASPSPPQNQKSADQDNRSLCPVKWKDLLWLGCTGFVKNQEEDWSGSVASIAGPAQYFSKSLEGQFSITKDTSVNVVYLEVKSLKQEDSAVYYCAREPQ